MLLRYRWDCIVLVDKRMIPDDEKCSCRVEVRLAYFVNRNHIAQSHIFIESTVHRDLSSFAFVQYLTLGCLTALDAEVVRNCPDS
jgi:hypothetical protein